MSLYHCSCTLLLAAVAIVSGCCNKAPWPCGNTYCGTQCGCLYWHEWFSHKPCCCDPCDTCGNFTQSNNPYVVNGPYYTPFGPVYSDGSGSNAPGAAGQLYPTPAGPTPSGGPSPQPGVLDQDAPGGEMMPDPGQEMPGPTTRMRPPGGYPRTATRYDPVDSSRGSRTLGRPSRTRLFSR